MKSSSKIEVMEPNTTIKPKQMYSVRDLETMGTFPWAKDNRTIIKLIEQDMKADNILQATKTGSGRQTRYQMQGANINKYIKKYGAILMATARKPYERNNKEANRS